jgi:hypothetical protein
MIECLHTDSRCYRAAQEAIPVGIVLHSTGANNTALKRYVQPSTDDPARGDLLALIGKNANGNHWNRDIKKSVHYIIGKRADGLVDAAHILPEEFCAWGVGTGKKGSYNYNPTAHIQVEVCEDALTDEKYFFACYYEAIHLCADICARRGWEADVIVSHKEAYKRGYATNHGDIDHWLKKFGMTMDILRTDVDLLLHPEKEIVIGDKVRFVGDTQYTNSGKLLGKKAKPCEAKVLDIYQLGKARHPYLVKGSGVYGWVDEDSIIKEK